ncbi:MAG: hypothetical protein WCV90_07050 [Candidatus Woesearchaeota archaeon]
MGEESHHLEQIYVLAESNPAELLNQVAKIRELRLKGKDLPEKLLSLAPYVYPLEMLQRRGFAEFMLLDEYSLSYATPQKFARHRAQKISAYYPDCSVADISCGAGGQLLELCKEGSAIGIEKDQVRYWLAKINLALAHYLKIIHFNPAIYNEDALNSLKVLPLLNEIKVILCDSWRDAGTYSPDLHELYQLYSDKYLVYEFKPLEQVGKIFQKYPFLFGKCVLEYYGEEDRCSRLTAYHGRGKAVEFLQEEGMNWNLSMSHERAEGAVDQAKEKLIQGFPTHDFFVLNKGIVEKGFSSLLNFPVFQVDRKRFLVELGSASSIKVVKFFSPIVSSADIVEISTYLQENYDDYHVTLRLEIPSEEYWGFVQDNHLLTNKESPNRFSLFRYKDVFHLVEEKKV